jgi:hypothetical protein
MVEKHGLFGNQTIILIQIVGGWSPDWVHWHVGHWMAYCTCPGWLWLWRIWWNEDWQGKSKYSEKTCPIATLATTNLTWPDPGLNPGRRGGKPATNRLSYGAAMTIILTMQKLIWRACSCTLLDKNKLINVLKDVKVEYYYIQFQNTENFGKDMWNGWIFLNKIYILYII